jgi:hypothetical protein
MERVAVQSNEIAVVGYSAETSTLEITFRRGGVYHYLNVPEEVHRALLQASSVGTYFAQQIKDVYSCQKIR